MKKRLLSIAAIGVFAAAAFVSAASFVETESANIIAPTTDTLSAKTKASSSSNAGKKIYEDEDAYLSIGTVSATANTTSYVYDNTTYNSGYTSSKAGTAYDSFVITAEAGTTVGVYYGIKSTRKWGFYGSNDLYVTEAGKGSSAKVYQTINVNTDAITGFFGSLGWASYNGNYLEYTFEEAGSIALKSSYDKLTILDFKEVYGEKDRVAEAEAAISAIGAVTYSNESAELIKAAGEAIAKVNNTDKISNLDLYNNAVETYNAYVAADEAAAAEADELILALGDVEYTEEYAAKLAAIEAKLANVTNATVANLEVFEAKKAEYEALKEAAIANFTSLVETASNTEVSRATGCAVAKAEAALESIVSSDLALVSSVVEELQTVTAAYEDYMTDDQVVAESLKNNTVVESEDYVMSEQVTLLNVSEIAEDYVKADGAKLTLDLTSTITMTIVPENNTLYVYNEAGELVQTLEVTDGTVEFTLTAGTYTVVPATTPVDFYGVKVVNELGFDSIEMYSEIFYDETGRAYITYATKVTGVNGLVDLADYSLTIQYKNKTLTRIPTRIYTTETTYGGTVLEASENTYYFVYILSIKAASVVNYAGIEFNTYFTVNGVNSDTISNVFVEAE